MGAPAAEPGLAGEVNRDHGGTPIHADEADACRGAACPGRFRRARGCGFGRDRRGRGLPVEPTTQLHFSRLLVLTPQLDWIIVESSRAITHERDRR